MTIRIVRLGSPRLPREGLRIGSVRRPPRGVAKSQIARRNFYDVWLPVLSPSAPLVRQALDARTEAEWRKFSRKFHAEMRRPDAARTLDLLTALSSRTNFSVGCYCQDESRCHRSILRKLLIERGAKVD
jgi:uncharacterized protein YeaO (DUF488 family)